jgi:hypothetical protein
LLRFAGLGSTFYTSGIGCRTSFNVLPATPGVESRATRISRSGNIGPNSVLTAQKFDLGYLNLRAGFFESDYRFS